MHVLLINCHNGSDESNKTWKEFEKQVRKCFSHMIEMMHFSVRKLNELAEYFDKVDFIFLDGEKSFKPWAAASKPLITLIKMCCQVGFKCVFGTTPLMASLCFVIATGGKDTKIKGKGGSIASLQQGDVESSPNTLYLNNRTGDAYQSLPNTEAPQGPTTSSHIWKPVVNVGLKVHVPPHGSNSDVLRSVSESLLKKNKSFLHHWTFSGIPDQFVVPTASHFWDLADIPSWLGPSSSSSSSSSSSATSSSSSTPSPSALPSPSVSPSYRDAFCSSLNILASIECGPAMLEYESMVAVHFTITDIYPSTIAKLDVMMSFGNQEYPSHRLYKKLVAVGNFSKFEERPKPTLARPRSQPFPDPLLPLSSLTIIPKIKIPLSPSSPSSSSSPLLSSISRSSYSSTSANPPFRFSQSPIRRVNSVSPQKQRKPKEEKDKDKDKLSLPIVKVPLTTKTPPLPRQRAWHTPPDSSLLYD